MNMTKSKMTTIAWHRTLWFRRNDTITCFYFYVFLSIYLDLYCLITM